MGHTPNLQGRSPATDSALDDLHMRTAFHETDLQHLLCDGVLRGVLPPPRRGEYPGETPVEGAEAVARWIALHDRARELRSALRPGDGVGDRQVQRAIRSLFLYEHQLTPKTRRQARTALWRRERVEALPAFSERARWARCRCTQCQPLPPSVSATNNASQAIVLSRSA
jgi:hypothetical protein